jgi:cyanate lyase
MKIPEVTDQLLTAKKQKGLTFADLEKSVGRDEVWIARLLFIARQVPPRKKH